MKKPLQQQQLIQILMGNSIAYSYRTHTFSRSIFSNIYWKQVDATPNWLNTVII